MLEGGTGKVQKERAYLLLLSHTVCTRDTCLREPLPLGSFLQPRGLPGAEVNQAGICHFVQVALTCGNGTEERGRR